MIMTIDIDTNFSEEALEIAKDIIEEIKKLYPERDAQIQKLELF